MGLPDILVVGAGVSGLTTAVCLAEAGNAVRVITQLSPGQTTSAVAGASWGPYMVDDQRVLDWSGETRRELEKIAQEPSSGVRLVNGLEAADEPMEAPGWALEVADFRPCNPADLPKPYVFGWWYTIPLVDMPRYLEYLSRRLESAGGVVEFGTVSSFDEMAGQAAVLINCTGLKSRGLVPDDAVFPVRGQLVVVENPGVDWFFQDNTHGGDMTYFLPHPDYVVLGGSAMEDRQDMDPDPDVTRQIIERCVAIEPKLRDARVIRSRVGLRPMRARVRVERVDTSGGVPLIHNYGHGGAGLTLSWGCAREVARIAT